ncbi:dihydrodipicolinate synthase family protein [Consotaella salsifontis]|uniref:4-hydroxy-tetrahydrodipicolinate synthase n=1 Tax=Consotaella salsifontis TaxID=1365950 RepID=A0A1T4S7P5_9HYPH|nr:dihydrodipicolinate synthase family protein [Consotaella salsifontis]SKA23928.1 4-hydroxy-tetrahydrodipicolinate synthase [Consotaella salsifontis]
MSNESQTPQDRHSGVWPVMLTPFTDEMEIDWASLERLIDWYIGAGVHGLFADCQSSEMFFLTDKESVELTRFVVDYTAGRVPVVASGHTAGAPSRQIEQLQAIAETGVDSVILISNRLATADESDAAALKRLIALTEKIPTSVGIGIYECPYPYKRLISDEMAKWCAQSGRYTFIKDTCCNLETLKRRAAIVEGTQLHIANANAQTLLDSLKAGVHGYSGVMANFHPELYVWLVENWQSQPEKAEILSHYLTTAALAESLDYPVCAKAFQKEIGNFTTDRCRTRPIGGYYANHFPTTIRQMIALGNEMKQLLSIG